MRSGPQRLGNAVPYDSRQQYSSGLGRKKGLQSGWQQFSPLSHCPANFYSIFQKRKKPRSRKPLNSSLRYPLSASRPGGDSGPHNWGVCHSSRNFSFAQSLGVSRARAKRYQPGAGGRGKAASSPAGDGHLHPRGRDGRTQLVQVPDAGSAGVAAVHLGWRRGGLVQRPHPKLLQMKAPSPAPGRPG